MRVAVEMVARYRHVDVRPLARLVHGMPDLAQHRWAVWRRNQHLEATTPEQFGELLDVCLTFADAVLDEGARGRTWDPTTGMWTEASGSV